MMADVVVVMVVVVVVMVRWLSWSLWSCLYDVGCGDARDGNGEQNMAVVVVVVRER
jgi:hypothetical protein